MNLSIPSKGKSLPARIDHCLPKEELLRNKVWIVLTHGAGGDMNTPQLAAVASFLTKLEFVVLRFTCKGLNIKYRIRVFNDVINFLWKSYEPKGIFIGGRSMGSRAAVMLASDDAFIENASVLDKIMGIICLSYPLHKAKKLNELRDEPLRKLQKPIFFLSGSKDEMCEKDLLEKVLLDVKCHYKICWLKDLGHSVVSYKNYTEDIYCAAFREMSDWCLNICKSQ